ncbi:MAG: toll/interleukin-1 receptor domain-containing protein [Treponema sp.]|nr:toll/interleukin-1 receptor domain-containing protein [Treponema sp.]
MGDSLRRKIDKGLANSRFGVVVLSKSFINKG